MTSQKFPGIEADGTVSASTTAGTIRTNLGLGTAALANTGTTNGTVPLLDATGLPAVNGSQLTNVTGITAAGAVAASTDAATIRGNLSVGMVDGGAGEITTPAAPPTGKRSLAIKDDGTSEFTRRTVVNLSEWGVSPAAVDNGERINTAIQDWYAAAVSGNSALELWDFVIDPGTYYIEVPIVFGYQSGGVWQFGYNTPALRAANKNRPVSQAEPMSSPRLVAQFNDAPLISTQGTRGLVIDGLQLTGQTSAIGTSFSAWTEATFTGRSNNTPSTDATYGRWSPSALIAIDPFGQGPDEGVAGGPPTASRYQNANIPSSYYTSANKFSSYILIKDCLLENCEVGILMGSGTDSNADGIQIHGCNMRNLTYAVSTCHAQNKNIYVEKCQLNNIWIGFTGQTHGRRAGLPPASVELGNSGNIGCLFYNFNPSIGSLHCHSALIEVIASVFDNPTSEGTVTGNAANVTLENMSLVCFDLPAFRYQVNTMRPLIMRECQFSKSTGSAFRLRNAAGADPPEVFDTVSAEIQGHEHIYENCYFDGTVLTLWGDEIIRPLALTAERRDWIRFVNCSTVSSTSARAIPLNGRAHNLGVGDFRGVAGDCTGATGYVTTGNGALQYQDSLVTEPFTIGMWVYLDQNQNYNGLFGDNWNQAAWSAFSDASGDIFWNWGGASLGTNRVKFESADLVPKLWTHLLFAFDGATSFSLYRNGALVSTETMTTPVIPNHAGVPNMSVAFGAAECFTPTSVLDGRLSRIIFFKGFNKAAFAAQICNGTYTTDATNSWLLNETSGPSVDAISTKDLTWGATHSYVDSTTNFPEGNREYSKQLAARTLTPDDPAASQSIAWIDSSGNLRHKVNISSTVKSAVLMQYSETITTPSGASPAAAIDLTDGGYQTLVCTSATGTVAVTLTVPGSVASGKLVVKQHASTSVDISWAASSGSIVWLGTEPTWSSDTVSAVRIVEWRYDGTDTYLWSTGASA